MHPAIILARVSTPEQEAGHSLEAQLANLQAYAERKGLDIVQVYRIIESSTKGYRPEFERMIEFLKRQKSRHALVVDCVDRLQRSFTHTPVLSSLMEKNILEIHFVREGNIIDKEANSMQKMMWNMGTVMAQSYTDQLSDNIRRSIKHKLAKGEWIGMAPLGYLNAADPSTGRSMIVIDPKRAPLIQKLFNDYASGIYSMAELARKSGNEGLLSRKGKSLYTQTVAKILSNPFYSGMMRIKGKLYPHNYPKLVEPSVFKACEGRKRYANMPQQAIRITRHPFLLRGLVTCAASGRKATCALQKKQYVYLMVRSPANQSKVIWIPEETVLKQITNALQSFAMPQELLTDVLGYIQKTDEQDKQRDKTTAKELQTEQTQLTQKLSRLTDLLIDGSIGKEIYEAKSQEIRLRQKEIESRLMQMKQPADSANIANDDRLSLVNVITMLSQSAETFVSSKTDQKRQMLGFVFSNLQMEGATLRYSLRKPFEVIQQLPHNPKWRRGRDSNPRYGSSPYIRFPGERLQPLGHLSVCIYMTVSKFFVKSYLENPV